MTELFFFFGKIKIFFLKFKAQIDYICDFYIC